MKKVNLSWVMNFLAVVMLMPAISHGNEAIDIAKLKAEIKAEIIAEMKAEQDKKDKTPSMPVQQSNSSDSINSIEKSSDQSQQKIAFTKSGLCLDGKLCASGQIRVRPELRRNLTQGIPNIPANIEEDFSVLLRSRLGLLFKPVDHISFFIQAEDSRDFGEEVSATPLASGDDEGIDLHQGYIDITHIGGNPLSIRIGRQEVSLGEQRLVGAVDWSNVGRSLDALVISYQPDAWGLTALASIINKTPSNSGDGQYVGGLYGSWKKFPGGVLDAYYLLLQDNDGAKGAAAGSGDTLSVHTVGTRIAAKYENGIDFGIESAVQLGKFGSNDILSFAEHVALGYTFDTSWKPRLGLEYNYATGDDGGNNRYSKFNNLLPTNHNKYGMMDLVAWSNMHDAAVHVGVKPGKYSLSAAYHLLAVDKNTSPTDTIDGVYAGAPGIGKIFGHEIDFQGKWTMNEYFEVGAGYGHLIPGPFLKNQGQTQHSDFFYTSVQAQF